MIKCNFCKCEMGPKTYATVGELQIMEFHVNINHSKCDRKLQTNHGIVTACGSCLIKIYQFFNSICGVEHGDYTECHWRAKK